MTVELVAGAAAFALATALTRIVRDVARRRRLLDAPNDRSAHRIPTPRLGGVAIMATFFAAAGGLWLAGHLPGAALAVLGPTALIAAVGLADDLRPRPAAVRFAFQSAAALAVIAAAGDALPAAYGPSLAALPLWALRVVTFLWLVWVTNLFNFMDGIDGFAGGQTVLAAAALGVCAALLGAGPTGALTAALAGAALGFLVFNAPPASIFMGDAGSTGIGFFLAALPFLPEARPVPVEAVAVALAYFGLDATTTLVRRIARRERFFEAHRSHYYQRVVALGFPHRPVMLAGWVAMLVAGVAAVTYVRTDGPGALVAPAVPLGVFVALVAIVRRLEAHARRGRS